jgi:hypothetical protein
MNLAFRPCALLNQETARASLRSAPDTNHTSQKSDTDSAQLPHIPTREFSAEQVGASIPPNARMNIQARILVRVLLWLVSVRVSDPDGPSTARLPPNV